MHVFFEFLKDLVVEVIGVGEEAIEPPDDGIQTFGLVDGDSALEVLDVEEDGCGLVEVVDHVLDSGAVVGGLVGSAEELGLGRSLHGGAGLLVADVLEGGRQQVQLQNELPDVLVLPDVEVDLLRTLNYPLDVRRVVP